MSVPQFGSTGVANCINDELDLLIELLFFFSTLTQICERRNTFIVEDSCQDRTFENATCRPNFNWQYLFVYRSR
jgi:hypothetical protein